MILGRPTAVWKVINTDPNTAQVPGWGNLKSVPTIESLFPFDKTGFAASPTLFSAKSMIVFENPLGGCAALNPKP